MTEAYREINKEEAIEAFKALLERDDVAEIEVKKVFFREENKTYYEKLVFRVVLK